MGQLNWAIAGIMLTRLNKVALVFGIFLIGMGTVLLVGYLVRGSIKSVINGYRAERLFEQAQSEFAAENWAQASRKGVAAFYLDTGNPDIRLLIARSYLKQRQPAAIEWWKLALNHPDIPLDELRELTDVLLGVNRLDDGLLFLSRLVELDGMNPATQELWFKALTLQARYTNSLALASDLIAEGTDEWAVHRHYISMQEALAGDKGRSLAIGHLTQLITSDSSLSLYAARELAGRKDAPLDARLMAADYLIQSGKTEIDGLYAKSVQVREGVADSETLKPVLESILEEPGEQGLADLARWAIWMDWADWFVERVDWQTFRENGNEPELYLRTMVEAGLNQKLIALSQQLGTSGGNDSPVFLYYRALAWENLGDHEQAEEILTLATQVIDPAESKTLERYLKRDNRADLLLNLYESQLKDNPGDPILLQSLISTHYSLGHQDALESLLRQVETTDYTGIPPMQSFTLYLKLLLAEDTTELHKDLESLLARYPEVFDFRMVLGVSYLLQGQQQLAKEFADQMPSLSLSAPRYLRICAMLVGKGDKELLAPGEIELLLPRERLLLSQVARQATR